ncbi:unnamed protein product, partial [Heterosigma akashiwo]
LRPNHQALGPAQPSCPGVRPCCPPGHPGARRWPRRPRRLLFSLRGVLPSSHKQRAA